MYKIISGSDHNLNDVRIFIETINKLDNNKIPEARFLFDKKNDLIVTRAPGRLDVMGGIADYSGSLVLQLPIKEAALSAIQLSANRKIRIVSLSSDNIERSSYFEMPLDDFLSSGKPCLLTAES
jgi:L-arabinokinase